MNLEQLLKEKSELDARIKEMQNYMEDNNISSVMGMMPATMPGETAGKKAKTVEISDFERQDINQQFTAMKQYGEVLQRRINRL